MTPDFDSLPLTLSNWIDRLPDTPRAELMRRATLRRFGPREFIWQEQGIVELKYGNVTILDLARLDQLAAGSG